MDLDNQSKKADLNKKILQIMTIAKNVCKQSKTIDCTTWSKEYFKKITGLDRSESKKVPEPLTFEKLKHHGDKHLIVQSRRSVSEFRALLKEHYFKEKHIPSLRILNDSAESAKDPLHENETSKVFVLKTLPGLTKGIIIEDTEVVHQRILYLKKIQEIRNDNKQIVYIKHQKYGSNLIKHNRGNDKQTHLFLAVSTQIGLLEAFFCSSNKDFIIKWIFNAILSIGGSCAILMDEVEFEIPTRLSSKAKMSHWLTDNDVLHDPTAHRGEMYELIEKTVANGHMSKAKIDDVIAAEGHQVVRYPIHAPELDYFDSFIHGFFIANPLLRKKTRYDILREINCLSLSDWQQFESVLIEKEKQMYQEDLLMERVVDNLCMMAADGKIPIDVSKRLTDAADWKKYSSLIVAE